MDVDGPQLDLAVAAPDRVEQPLAREDPAGMLEEMLEQPELGRPERDRLRRRAAAGGSTRSISMSA